MSYALQLLCLLTIGLLTLLFKIRYAIAKERKLSAEITKEASPLSWPYEVASVKSKRGIFLALLIFCSGLSQANVHANFAPDKSEGCSPFGVNFANLSSGNTSCYWDFGNGNTSALNNPSATFLTSGTYQVKLVVTNGLEIDSFIKTIVVFQNPVVNFTVSKTTACLGDTIQFQNMVTTASAPIVSYAWGFGNGRASSIENAAYKYSQPGIYDVTLVVRDSNQCSAHKTIAGLIHVYSNPVTTFSATPQTSCNATQTVAFTNYSTGAGLSYLWNLDTNTNCSMQNPVHTYHQESYNVTLVATDTNGCSGVAMEVITAKELIANFTVSNTKPCTGQNVLFRNTSNFTGNWWFWDFGDGTTSTLNNPNKIYNSPGYYSVKFKVKDGSCNDSIARISYIHVITGFVTNAVSFSADTTIACAAPFTVHFSNNTPGINQSQFNYHWTFGNGDTSDIQNPAYTFNAEGSFSISLTITDSNGCTITGKVNNFIIAHPPVPNAVFDTTACPGSPVNFQSQAQDATSVLWRFGDGDSSTNVHATHIYANSGHYTVTFTARNSAGCDSTIILHPAVNVQPVLSDFIVSDSFSMCPPFVTLFSNLSSHTANNFIWDFGDGYTDTTASPTHIYFHPGVFTVKLIASGRNGYCSDTTVRAHLITVQGPMGVFSLSPATGCVPLTVGFAGSVSLNTKNIWCDLGDGHVIPDSTNFSHIYSQARVYHPEFILTDHVGCSVPYVLDSITVHSNPAISGIDTSVCQGTILHASLTGCQNNYTWIPANFLDCDTCGTVSINTPSSVSYAVKATNIYGCQSTASIHIDIKPLPRLTDSTQVSLCPGDTCRLFVGNALKINWSPGQYLSDSTSGAPLCTPLGPKVYTVTAQDSNSCTASTQVAINIKNKISVLFADSIVTCPGLPVELKTNLNGSYQNEVRFQWSPAQYLNNANVASPLATIPDSVMQFQFIASNGHCASDTEKIIVYTDVPVIHVPATIDTVAYAEVTLNATSSEALNYEWYAADAVNCNTCATSTLRPSASQMVYVEGINNVGCITKDSVQINVIAGDLANIFIPNAFTPNGDGKNDVFQIYGDMHDVAFLQARIFDRWGEEVFASNAFDFKWDGTYKGAIQPPAVYTYQIELAFIDGHTKEMKSGGVALLR